MVESPNNLWRWQMPKLSTAQLLVIALSLSLLFSVFLLIRLGERNQESLQTPLLPTQSSINIVQFDGVNGQTPSSNGSVTYSASDFDILVSQLTDSQSRLQILSGQLEQKGQASDYPSTTGIEQAPLPNVDLATLWNEIEQLYQVMQPLMAQVETASASHSSRSASELIALRTQVNTIHQRLANLLQQVEVAKTRPNMTFSYSNWSGNRQWGLITEPATTAASSNQVLVDQLYQNMTEMNNMLLRLQGQGYYP